MQKYLLYGVGLSVLLLGMAGCASSPTVFGMPASQFNQLSPEQQDVVIADYNAQQTADARHAATFHAVNGLVGTALSATHYHKTIASSESSSHYQNCYQSGGAVHCDATERHSGSDVHIGVG